MIKNETEYTCDKCAKPIIGTVYLGDGGHYHRECVPLPARVQAEEAELAKAKAVTIEPSVTYPEIRMADPLPPRYRALVARVREMAAHRKRIEHCGKAAYDAGLAEAHAKYLGPTSGENFWRLCAASYLKCASDLLKILEGESK